MNRQYLINKIGSPLPPEMLVVADQDAYDIIKRMVIKHKNCACDYDKIAADFDAQDIYDVCKKLWVFCKNNLKYDEETIDRQEVSAPQTILQRGHCDCKGYALFIGGILDALNRRGWNIKWKYRFASDNLFNETPGHVFVVVTDGLHEIWVDPVLSEFNQDHFFPYYQDRRVTVPVAVGRCGCDNAAIGATADYGTMLIKIAPALAEIPVLGWIGGAAAVVIGGIISIVGTRFNQSGDVRWLVQLFQYYVQGNAAVTSDNKVNEALTPQAQAFFSVVLGVPIGGRKDLNILQSGDGNTNTPTGQTAAQRAQNYLAFKDLQGLVTIDQATQAAQIAAASFKFSGPPGSWAGLTAAPSTIQKDPAETPTTYVNQYGQMTTAAGVPVAGHNNLILLAAGAAVLFLLIK